MTYTQLVKALAERFNWSQAEIKRVLQSSFEVIRNMLDHGDRVILKDLGTLDTNLNKPRRSFNPQIKKPILLPTKKIVTFNPSSVLKNHVKFIRIENE